METLQCPKVWLELVITVQQRDLLFRPCRYSFLVGVPVTRRNRCAKTCSGNRYVDNHKKVTPVGGKDKSGWCDDCCDPGRCPKIESPHMPPFWMRISVHAGVSKESIHEDQEATHYIFTTSYRTGYNNEFIWGVMDAPPPSFWAICQKTRLKRRILLQFILIYISKQLPTNIWYTTFLTIDWM